MDFALEKADPVSDMRCIMADGESYQLKQTIERSYGCAASLIQSVRLREFFEQTRAWEGVVHVFELTGHPKAIRAYGWFSSSKNGEKRHPHSVLHTPHISSPRKAIQAVLTTERKPLLRRLQSAS